MKFFALCLLAFAPSLASAATIQAQLDAKNSERYSSATITYDQTQHTIELSLQPKMPACADGMMCIQVMPQPIVYLLEDVRSETDGCQVVRTSVQFDQRPVDGIYLKLQFNDNRNNTCPTFVALAPVDAYVEQAYYNRLKGKEVRSLDLFEGLSIEKL
jgi:hypothetical protein